MWGHMQIQSYDRQKLDGRIQLQYFLKLGEPIAKKKWLGTQLLLNP